MKFSLREHNQAGDPSVMLQGLIPKRRSAHEPANMTVYPDIKGYLYSLATSRKQLILSIMIESVLNLRASGQRNAVPQVQANKARMASPA